MNGSSEWLYTRMTNYRSEGVVIRYILSFTLLHSFRLSIPHTLYRRLYTLYSLLHSIATLYTLSHYRHSIHSYTFITLSIHSFTLQSDIQSIYSLHSLIHSIRSLHSIYISYTLLHHIDSFTVYIPTNTIYALYDHYSLLDQHNVIYTLLTLDGTIFDHKPTGLTIYPILTFLHSFMTLRLFYSFTTFLLFYNIQTFFNFKRGGYNVT